MGPTAGVDTVCGRHDSNVPLRHPTMHLEQRVLLRGPQSSVSASSTSRTSARVARFGWRCSDHHVLRWKVGNVPWWHNGLCRRLLYRALWVEMSMQLLQLLVVGCKMQGWLAIKTTLFCTRWIEFVQPRS